MNHKLLFSLLSIAALAPGCAQAAPVKNPGAPVTKAAVPNPANVSEKAGDLFLLPTGAGTRDGSSWANALDGSAGLQAGWDKLQPGQTLWVGSGDYPNAKLKISAGGEAGQLKTLAGKDTGKGAPNFTGTFNKDNPAKSGSTFITLDEGADYWAVQDISIHDYSLGIASKNGGHEGVRIRNFDVTGSREGITLQGGGTADKPADGSHDWEISDCEFKNFTKRGIRLRNGNYDFKITDCVADAGGREWATEPFHMGFNVIGAEKKENAPDHDITFTRCVALNSYHNAGDKYWNGDGFCGERSANNLRFVNCMAFDNTDGGWDFKSENVTLENCISIGNKRNYRFWGSSTKLINCLSAYPVHPGGSGGALGLWTKGTVDVEKSTFFDAPIEADEGGKITTANSIIARDKDRPAKGPMTEISGVTMTGDVVWNEADGKGTDPQLVAPTKMWEGEGNAFNSQKFGAAKGFINTMPAVLSFDRTLPLVSSKSSDGGVKKPATAPGAATPVAETPKTPAEIAADAAAMPTIQNGGFEDGLSGWSKAKAPAFQVKTEGAAQGEKFLAVSADKRTEAQATITGLVVGESYTITFQSRGNTSADARLIVRASANGKYLKYAKPSADATWKNTSITFEAPSDSVALQVSLREAGAFDLDNFEVKRAG